MFVLTENRYLSENVCIYTDECGNTAKVRRKEGKFVIHLKFGDERARAHAFAVNFPLDKDFKGVSVNITVSGGKSMEDEDVQAGIKNTTALVEYWIDMLQACLFLEVSPMFFKKADGTTPTTEEISQHKLERLLKYPELKDCVMQP